MANLDTFITSAQEMLKSAGMLDGLMRFRKPGGTTPTGQGRAVSTPAEFALHSVTPSPVPQTGRGFQNPSMLQGVKKAYPRAPGLDSSKPWLNRSSLKRRAWATDTRRMRNLGKAGLIGAGVLGAGYLAHRMFSKDDD